MGTGERAGERGPSGEVLVRCDEEKGDRVVARVTTLLRSAILVDSWASPLPLEMSAQFKAGSSLDVEIRLCGYQATRNFIIHPLIAPHVHDR